MMGFGVVVRGLVAGLAVVWSVLGVAQAQTVTTNPDKISPTQPSKAPTDLIGSGGEYTETFDFDLPAFRGLEPDLRLVYNSANTSRGGFDNTVAFGWRLAGLSMIEQKSVGGGVPTFDNGQDIFVLDGQELMACDDAAATNKWSLNPYGWKYPLRYLTTAPSASCSAGGNLTTRVESYRKIEWRSGNTFLVTDPDGTRYVYTPVGTLAGDTSAWPADGAKMGQHMRWLLTEITDSQKDAAGNYTNKVTIGYFIHPAAYGFPAIPTTISYGGYQVVLDYEATTTPFTQFGTGTAVLGQNWARLRSVMVNDSGTKVRAYRLVTTASALTQTPLLQRVESYGSDFVVTSAGAAGGTKLPDVSYEYSPDTFALTPQTYAGREFHSHNLITDWDYDGKDHLILFSGNLRRTREGGGNGGDITYPLFYSHAAAHLSFDAGRNVQTRAAISPYCQDQTVPVNPLYSPADALDYPYPQKQLILGDRSGSSRFCLKKTTTYYEVNDKPHTRWTVSSHDLTSAAGSAVGSLGYSLSEGALPDGFVLGNVDRDPQPELIVYVDGNNSGNPIAAIYDAKNGVFSQQPFSASLMLSDFVDLNGDGVDELFGLRTSGASGATSKYAWSTSIFAEAGYVGGVLRGQGEATLFPIGASPVAPLISEWIGSPTYDKGEPIFGDFNGDGLTDYLAWNDNDNGGDAVRVRYSTGGGLASPITHTFWNIAAGTDTSMAAAIAADVNSDGLSDIIVHQGYEPFTRTTAPLSTPRAYTRKPTYIFLNTGSGFVLQSVNGAWTFPGYVGHGDFDGNGLTDFVIEGANGQILWSTGAVPNRLKAVNRASGGRTEIAYAPSSQRVSGPNQIPGVQQVVASVTERDGRGNARTTSYTYANGRYDFINRKALGYDTVTATLEPLAGETAGPVITTIYLNNNFVDASLVKSQTVTVGGTVTWSKLINDWSVTKNGQAVTFLANQAPETGGPFKIEKVKERTAYLQGDQLIETMKEFGYNLQGQITAIADYGFSNNGVNIATGDDVTERRWYLPNATTYVANRPTASRTYKGANPGADISQGNMAIWLSETQFVYDGNASASLAPTEGNLTKTLQWTGNTQTFAQIERGSFSYDDWGNVLTERDTKGNVTTHAYEATKHLFRVSSTNALSQSVQTAWNSACQAPASQTDANGLITSFAYDVFCRETRRDLPGGQYLKTAFVNIGNAATQYVEKESLSPSTVAGSDKKISRDYMDGFGQVYLSAATDATSDITQGVAVRSDYDKRGNLDWQSIPLTWAAAAAGAPPTNQRTTFRYDALNRPVKTTHPDGAVETLWYTYNSETRYGASHFVPAIRSLDAQCYDLTAAGTICGDQTTSFDAAGRTIRTKLTDTALTDVGATGSARITTYTFDLLGRLTGVTDPGGITFAYTYDIFGNRTQATDPGLGTWSMAYDLNGNLTSQTDAKGQLITFTYDALNRVTLKTVGTGTTRIETRFTYDQVRAGYYNIGRLTTQEVTAPGAASVIHKIESDWHITGQAERTRHLIDPGTAQARTYTVTNVVGPDGSVRDVSLPTLPDGVTNSLLGPMTYDASGRVTAWSGFITSAAYDLRGNRTAITYANGAAEAATYDPARGWLMQVSGTEAGGAALFRAAYTRTASGRITGQDTTITVAGTVTDKAGSGTYAYDYAGRLLSVTNSQGVAGWTQSFTYDAAGRMRSNSLVGAYDYQNPTVAKHAPSTVTPASGPAQSLTYDQNGNMLTGLDGKVMSYDGENRPLSVAYAGKQTCYIYGADGARLKKLEGYTGTNCATPGANAEVTLYAGPIEVRSYGKGAATEQMSLYPSPGVRIVRKAATAQVISTLHYDGLGSVRAVTNAAGLKSETALYRPYGEQTEQTFTALLNETKGYIGERYDADAGLQYLNARYYDPRLGMFLQPDWWEVMIPGVGTNRYSYGFGDPVNSKDPSGHVIGDWFDSQEVSDSKNRDAAALAMERAKEAREKIGTEEPSLLDRFFMTSPDERYEKQAQKYEELAVEYAMRVGLPTSLRVRWDLGRSVRIGTDIAGLAIGLKAPKLAPGLVDVSAAQATMSAEAAADAALAGGKLSGGASELTVNGKVITAVSGESVPPNSQVTGALMGTPSANRAPWHGACAEIACLDKALNSGIDPAGGTMRTVNIGISGQGHNTPKAWCSSCRDILEFFGISE